MNNIVGVANFIIACNHKKAYKGEQVTDNGVWQLDKRALYSTAPDSITEAIESQKAFYSPRTKYAPEVEVIIYSEEKFSELAKTYPDDSGDSAFAFIRKIAYDDYAWYYRNPIHDKINRDIFIAFEGTCKFKFSLDVMQIEQYVIAYILSHKEDYADIIPVLSHDYLDNNYSVKQMVAIVNGQDWADRYQAMLPLSGVRGMIAEFVRLRNI